jgi:hypothetical protein
VRQPGERCCQHCASQLKTQSTCKAKCCENQSLEIFLECDQYCLVAYLCIAAAAAAAAVAAAAPTSTIAAAELAAAFAATGLAPL